MRRSELKQLVKECLIEIMAEGIGPSGGKQLAEASRRQAVQQQRQAPRARPAPNPAAIFKDKIAELTGGNKELSQILAQTAVETLPQILGAPDPERHQQQLQQDLGSSSFYSDMPRQSLQEEQQFYPQVQNDPELGGNSAWERAAFGKPSGNGPMMGLTPLPPAPVLRKLSDAELDRKVG